MAGFADRSRFHDVHTVSIRWGQRSPTIWAVHPVTQSSVVGLDLRILTNESFTSSSINARGLS